MHPTNLKIVKFAESDVQRAVRKANTSPRSPKMKSTQDPPTKLAVDSAYAPTYPAYGYSHICAHCSEVNRREEGEGKGGRGERKEEGPVRQHPYAAVHAHGYGHICTNCPEVNWREEKEKKGEESGKEGIRGAGEGETEGRRGGFQPPILPADGITVFALIGQRKLEERGKGGTRRREWKEKEKRGEGEGEGRGRGS